MLRLSLWFSCGKGFADCEIRFFLPCAALISQQIDSVAHSVSKLGNDSLTDSEIESLEARGVRYAVDGLKLLEERDSHVAMVLWFGLVDLRVVASDSV